MAKEKKSTNYKLAEYIGEQVEHLLYSLKYNETYHVYYDEGGMLGTPRWIISRTKQDDINIEDHFTLLKHKLDTQFISQHIKGRYAFWALADMKVKPWLKKEYFIIHL